MGNFESEPLYFAAWKRSSPDGIFDIGQVSCRSYPKAIAKAYLQSFKDKYSRTTTILVRDRGCCTKWPKNTYRGSYVCGGDLVSEWMAEENKSSAQE